MGLYPIDCPTCGIGHLWFSGNLDTRCGDCQKKNPAVKVCGHEACGLAGCLNCIQHCTKAIKLVKEKKNATKKTKRKGDSK